MLAGGALSAPHNVTVVSTSDTGLKGNAQSQSSVASADGTIVAFVSLASNLDSSDTDMLFDIYAKNLATSDLTLVSTSDSGAKSNAHSFYPSISADGTKVAFVSGATNLHPGDTDTQPDVYVKDLTTGELTLASTSDAGVKGDHGGIQPALSGDGTKVAFSSTSSNLDPAMPFNRSHIYVKNLTTGDISLASTSDFGDPGGGFNNSPMVSHDGTSVAFDSTATNLDPADVDAISDIYVKNLGTGDIALASRSDGGTKGNGASTRPSLSADGTKVAFRSQATNLDVADTDGALDVYVKNVGTGDLFLASTSDAGAKGNGTSDVPAISADGARVAFTAAATNLDPADSTSEQDVYVKELATGDIVLASTSDTGRKGNRLSLGPRLSSDGAKVAFESQATNLDPVDREASLDVFLKELGTGPPPTPIGDLSVLIGDFPDPIAAGGELRYIIEIRNEGPYEATNVELSNDLPDEATFVSATAGGFGGVCDTAADPVVCAWPIIEPFQTMFVNIVVQAPGAPTTLTNAASVTATSIDPDPFDDTAIATTEVREGADLSLTKTDSPDPAAVGEPLTYTLTVTNGGPGAAPNAMLADYLPFDFIATEITPSQGTCQPPDSDGAVFCELGTIANGAGATVTIKGTPTAEETLTNYGEIWSDEPDPDYSDNFVETETFVGTPGADLGVTKSDSPDPVGQGGQIRYTVRIDNEGPDRATEVELVDDLPDDVTLVSATASTGGACDTSTDPIVCTWAGVEAFDQASVEIRVTAPDAAATLTNNASVTAATTDPDPGNNEATETTEVRDSPASADLEVLKSAPSIVATGGQFEYFVEVVNLGPDIATEVELSNDLPDDVTFVSATASAGGVCDTSADPIVCTWASVDVFDEAFVEIVVTAPDAPTTLTNTASVTAATPDPDPDNNSATETTQVRNSADLSLTKTDAPDPAVVGESLTYTLNVDNHGPHAATNVTLTDFLDDVTVTEVAASQGSCTEDFGTVTCLLGTIENGATAVVTIEGTPNRGGTLFNFAQVESDEFDPEPDDNEAEITTEVKWLHDLAVAKTDSIDPIYVGDQVTYTVGVTNRGARQATDVVVTDTLPAGLLFVSGAGCTATGSTVTCPLGTLAAGVSAAATIVAEAHTSGMKTNQATVAAVEADQEESDNLATQTTAVRDNALEIARAIVTDDAWLTGAAFASIPPRGNPNAVGRSALSGFPRHGDAFGLLTNGDAELADGSGGFASANDGGGNVRGNTDYDVTVLRLDLNVPAGLNCASLDFRFLSTEAPGGSFNDAFVAELDTSDWSTSASAINAPHNFAFDPSGSVISVNGAGFTSMTEGNAAGTAYELGTPLLGASTPITAGAHSIYLSIFDQGDQILDSAVFVDRLKLASVPAGACNPGATILSTVKTADNPKTDSGGANGYTIRIDNPHSEPFTLTAIADDLPLGFSYVPGSTTGVTTAEPVINGQRLTWTGPFTLPAGGSVQLHFGVNVAALPGEYLNNASAEGEDVSISPTGQTAKVIVRPTVSVGNVTVTEGDTGTTDATFTVGLNGAGAETVTVDFATDDGTAAESSDYVASAGVLTFEPGQTSKTVKVSVNGDTAFEPDETFNLLLSGATNATIADGDGLATITNDDADANAPVAVDDSTSVDEDHFVDVAVLANDSDPNGDPLAVSSVTQGVRGDVTINADNTIRYEPDLNVNGLDSFTYTITDGHGGSDTATVSVSITPVNDAPVANGNAYEVDEDNTLTVAAPGVLGNDTDVDLDDLNAVEVAAPAHGTLTLNANGSFAYTPNANYNGGDSFTYMANDGLLDSNVVTVTITVNADNDAPVAAADSYSTAEEAPLTIAAAGVLANDSDPESASLSAVKVTDPANGTVALNTDGSFTYTPNSNFNGSDSFTYRANDGAANSNVATVTITVTPVNDAPVAQNQSVATAEDTARTITLAATDADSDPLTYAVVAGPSNGSLTGTAPNLTYTPALNFNGTETFTYRANDGTANSDPATVTITVTPAADPPNAVDDSATTTEDTPVDVDVLANDSDAEDGTLTIASFSQGANGSVALVAGRLRYTPGLNVNGSDSFTYRATDGALSSDPATVTITVGAVNDAPVAVNDTYSVSEDGSLTIAAPGVLANDTDVDSASLSAAKIADPAHGTATLNTDGSLTYTPDADFNGPDSFTYQANDGTLDSNVATVSITVTPVNDNQPALDPSGAPQMSSVAYGATDPPGDTVGAVLATGAGGDPISDADGDPEGVAVVGADGSIGTWQFSLDNGASWSALGAVTETSARLLADSARIRLIPNAGASGTSSFTFRAWDQSVGTNGQLYDTGFGLSANGASAFSAQTETVAVTVAAPATHTLTVTKSGAGSGTVTSSPPGINCGATCSASFVETTEVTLTATADAGAVFSSWTGDCTGAGFVCTLRMDAARGVTAQFDVARAPSQEPPPPVPFETVVVKPVSGTIKYRLPGTNTFIELQAGENVPLGTEIDATAGTIQLTSARPEGGVDTAEFFGGFFVIAQLNVTSAGRLAQQATAAFTELRLSGKVDFRRCPKAKTTAKKKTKKKRKSASYLATQPPKRRLWGRGKGRFRTRGRYSSATVRGTTWLTEDRCDGTLTRVTEGRVEVFDFTLRKRIQLRQGQSYLAKPKAAQTKKRSVGKAKKKPAKPKPRRRG